jgi:hypothetical protein
MIRAAPLQFVAARQTCAQERAFVRREPGIGRGASWRGVLLYRGWCERPMPSSRDHRGVA